MPIDKKARTLLARFDRLAVPQLCLEITRLVSELDRLSEENNQLRLELQDAWMDANWARDQLFQINEELEQRDQSLGLTVNADLHVIDLPCPQNRS